MNAEQYKKLFPKKFYREYLKKSVRPDGRGFLKCRRVAVKSGTVSTADGSSMVRIGDTTVVCGISLEVAAPPFSSPRQGELVVSLELSALCSSKYADNDESDRATAISQEIRRLVLSSGMIDRDDLCIDEGRSAWVLHANLSCLCDAGNVFDASVLALSAALDDTKIPAIQIDKRSKKVFFVDGAPTPLNLSHKLFSQTFAVFDDSILIADPNNTEEDLSQSPVSILCSYAHRDPPSADDGDLFEDDQMPAGIEVCGVYKPGGSPMPVKIMRSAMQSALASAQRFCSK